MTDKEKDLIYINKLKEALKGMREAENEISKDERSL